MEQLFRKHFWVIQLAIVALVAFLLALAINRFAGAWLMRFTVPDVPALGELEPTDEAPSRPFLSDTVFGETTPPPPPDPCADVTCPDGQVCRGGDCVEETEPEEEGPRQPELGEGRCLDSDIAMNLAGTMVAADPNWSLAILHNPSDNRTYFARIGKRLLEDFEVIRIERNRVFLLRDGIEECLRPGDQATRARRREAALQQAQQRAPTPTARPAADSRPRAERAVDANRVARSAPLSERLQDAVEQRSPTEYVIDRETLNEAANNASFMQQQAPQVVPVYQDGQASGFRLQGVRGDSIFGQLGIRNGDVLRSVDGQVIDSPQRALQLFESLMNRDRVELEVVRAGRSTTLVYGFR